MSKGVDTKEAAQQRANDARNAAIEILNGSKDTSAFVGPIRLAVIDLIESGYFAGIASTQKTLVERVTEASAKHPVVTVFVVMMGDDVFGVTADADAAFDWVNRNTKEGYNSARLHKMTLGELSPLSWEAALSENRDD